MTKHTCPRRVEGPQYDVVDSDDWITGRYGKGITTCTYCGSWNPDDVMAMLEAGTLALGPTDKNYKAYLHEPITQEDRDTAKEQWLKSPVAVAMFKTAGDPADVHKYYRDAEAPLVAGKQLPGKFYFQHLSGEQRQRFVELMNEKRIQYTYPGYFYTDPFFVRRG